jgi:hypothetical protein
MPLGNDLARKQAQMAKLIGYLETVKSGSQSTKARID